MKKNSQIIISIIGGITCFCLLFYYEDYSLNSEYSNCIISHPPSNCQVLLNYDGYYGFALEGSVIASGVVGFVIWFMLPNYSNRSTKFVEPKK